MGKIKNKFGGVYLTTVGVDFQDKVIQINDKKIRLQIWDTAGQERFRNIAKNYFHSSDGFLLVYDITNQDSLEQLKTMWSPDVQKYGEKYTILAVVGNKCDLYEGDNLADENMAKEFAKSIGFSQELCILPPVPITSK